MLKEIIASVQPDITRMAILEDGELMELSVETTCDTRRVVGNIYKGRVENVLPGMQAAFVDIGLEKNAFLFVSDIGDAERHARIEDVLKQGQEIMLQIAKDPIGTKGPRATGHITLPGRYLVLMPTVDYIGVSRRIDDEYERERLKLIAEKLKPEGMGLIVRTVAEGRTEQDFLQDIEYLTRLWKSLKDKAATIKSQSLVYRDVDLLNRVIRDIFSRDVGTFVVDSKQAYERAKDILGGIDPLLSSRIRMFEGPGKLFDHYHVHEQFDRLTKRKVWLKNGGYLVIDHTEALTVIDVNTGKYVGATSLSDTVFQTNLQAVGEICRQLRLRDIGGIIVIDFIDMESEDHRQQVLDTLNEHLKHDRTKTHVLGLTQLGLVEMTRKKSQSGLSTNMHRECPLCGGTGKVLVEQTSLM